MTEREFINFYKERNYSKNYKEAKEKIDLFWDVLLIALEEDKVVDGNIKFLRKGVFEIISRQPKTISNPVTRERMVIYPKKTVRFRASKMVSK